MNVILYKRFELRMFGVHFNSVGPKVRHVLCHCYAAINIFKIFKVLIIFSYNVNPGFKKVQCETSVYEYPGLLTPGK